MKKRKIDFDNGHTPETLVFILIISHGTAYTICLFCGSLWLLFLNKIIISENPGLELLSVV